MYQKSILPNGIRILTEEITSVRTAAVGVYVGVGSRDENAAEAGVSHFIEHLMFKGTENRSARQIAEAFDDIGGQLNAYTTKEYTCYYARVMDEHFDIAADILSDMLLHPRFNAEDIEKEKGVIIEEINMSEDSYDELVFDVFAEVLWHDQSLGKPILGTVESVSAMTRDQILNYYNYHYNTGNMVVAVAGNIKHQQVEQVISKLFGSRKAYDNYKKNRMPPQLSFFTSCKVKPCEQVNLCLGTQGVAIQDDDSYAIQVLSTILGGGVSSRLFQEIREEQGLVYTVYSYTNSYDDSGAFLIYAGLSSKNTGRAIGLILKNLKRMREEKVEAAELERAKNQLKVGLLFSMESVSSRMGRLGKAEIYKRKILSTDEIIAGIDAVTVEDILRLSQRFLDTDNFVLASVGPWETSLTVSELAEQTDDLAGGKGDNNGTEYI